MRGCYGDVVSLIMRQQNHTPIAASIAGFVDEYYLVSARACFLLSQADSAEK